jgi:hypothetical protein
MSASVDLAADVSQDHPGRDASAGRFTLPSGGDEYDVSSGWLVVATIWSALLAYACVQALLAE